MIQVTSCFLFFKTHLCSLNIIFNAKKTLKHSQGTRLVIIKNYLNLLKLLNEILKYILYYF